MKFVAFERQAQGTSASRRLRHSGKVPGIVYGSGEAQAIEIDHNALYHALNKEAFHSSILDMELDGKVSKVLLRDVQRHAYRQVILHVDFQRVDPTKKITLHVPVHFSGAEDSPAVKKEGQMINFLFTELEISCLPGQLPEFIAVDLSGLEKDGALHFADVKLPQGVTIVTHGHKTDESPILASASDIIEEVSAEEQAADSAAGAADGAPAATPAEGAAPADGAADADAAKK